MVVTHNRVDDLRICLDALRGQTCPLLDVVVVDNASTDDTADFLARQQDITVVRLSHNGGGAGGFKAGMDAASATSATWWWLMDDDCVPSSDALEQLLSVAAAAANGSDVAGVMPMVIWGGEERVCGYIRATDLPDDERDAGPFLGLLLLRDACASIAPIREDFVIWGDDTDYCLRLRMNGWRFLAAPDACVEHPRLPLEMFGIARWRFPVNVAPPWKQYYGARNSLLTNMLTRKSPVAAPAPRGGWLARELLDYVALVLMDRRQGPQRVAMRLYGRLDALRGRTGFTVVPGQVLPVHRGRGPRLRARSSP